jgi:hypothetical protein
MASWDWKGLRVCFELYFVYVVLFVIGKEVSWLQPWTKKTYIGNDIALTTW